MLASSGNALAMPAYGDRHSITINAAPQECFDALLDAEDLPRWQRALRSALVLERDDEGRPAIVEFEVDARVRTVRYRIRQCYFPPHRIASEYLGGDFRDFGGEWRFAPIDDRRTKVTLDLRIDPGRYVPRPIRALIADAVMTSALRDLKNHLER
jgi:ribosome-associated toxin RatA of RatAB toxin-antitoxin module